VNDGFQRSDRNLKASDVVNLDRRDLAFDGNRIQLVDFDDVFDL
jgi:hypothetical protein